MKYTIKKWSGWCPHWVVGVIGATGVIGFSSFYEALNHVKWALEAERQGKGEK
jgi:hypothetical protein